MFGGIKQTSLKIKSNLFLQHFYVGVSAIYFLSKKNFLKISIRTDHERLPTASELQGNSQ